MAGLLVAGFGTGIGGGVAHAADTSVLAKSVSDVTDPGADPARHGDVLNWTVSYADNSSGGPAAATITDPINGAPTAQTYVPGSLRVPQGWTPSWSTDGTNFQSTDQGAATVAVRATNPGARPGGTNLSALLLEPVQATATSTGGDGFTPVLYRNPGTGHVEVWNTYHHDPAPNAQLVCSDVSTEQLCDGTSWPKPLNTTPGPLGSGPASDISTTFTPQYVFDPGRPGVLYYPAYTAGAVGIGCLDLPNRANCGFFPLQNTGGASSSVNDIGGIVATGGNIYGVSTTGQVLCLAMASRTPCAGQPYAAVVPGNSDSPGTAQQYYRGGLTVADGKIFVSASPASGPAMGCFDPATSAACAGWSTPRTFGPAGDWNWGAEFTAFDTAGNETGACATDLSGTTRPSVSCYAFDGSALPAPTVFGSAPVGGYSLSTDTATAPDGHVHTYFPIWGSGVNGGTYCWDWNLAALCSGFPTPAVHPSANQGDTRDYGYTYDATTRCLYGLGDAGILFSEDPTTGATPCQHSGATTSLTPSTFYCDGAAGHMQGYTNAYLENMNLANVDLGASTVTVTDQNGTTIPTAGFAGDGTVDLSGISAAAHPTINVTAHLVLDNTNDFTGGNQPNLVVGFRGDPPQVCFQTTVNSTCTTTGVSNTATGMDATGALTSNTVSRPIAPGPGCQPKVSVNKEICTSADLDDCGPGGAGPWAKHSTPGLLGLLGVASWRITVTNAGPVDANQVTINDPAQPSCAADAGTFTLPANTSRQFYCSTFLLVLPYTNTATATFTPANSPAGTKPTTTAPSWATACSLLCVL
jgi:hypothetical protein